MAVVLVGCQPIEPGAGKPAPVALAFGFSSYMTVREAQDKVITRFPTRRVNHPSAATSHCPRFDTTDITVEGFVTEGFRGELLLSFVNNRLIDVTFAPDDAGPYLAWLRAHERRLSSGEPASAHGLKMVIKRANISPKQHGERPVVSWIEQDLRRQVGDWIDHCA